MTSDWRVVPLADARDTIAHAILHDEMIGETLGEVRLRPHQRVAASRLTSLIAAAGGAMLAEPVGVGKTYTALAVAACHDGPTLVVAPASLQAMWRDAARRCGLTIDVVSHEALSRGRTAPDASFIIIDEAHRARSPTTRRYARLADACRRARVLLVTATPVQNTIRDLASQLALFLGSARDRSDDELARYVVRGDDRSPGERPRLDGPHRIALDIEDDCLDQLLALPPPIPASDQGVAAALVTYGLLHQWTSSRAALVAALERRRSRGLALSAALDAGRAPTSAELSAWTHAGDALQLAFPELVTATTITSDEDGHALRVALDRHGAAIAALLTALRSRPDPDVRRADALRRIRAAHPGERIIAFCHYAESVRALRTILARDAGIAALTASGAMIASGRVSRDVVLRQFTPGTSGDSASRASRIDLLITTDLLSEGLNLQEASVIVHLDLPWNPARLDQRVGRALRLESRHPSVTVYTIDPPASTERLLQLEARLRAKLTVAQRAIGVAGRILPASITAASPATRGFAEERAAVETALRIWCSSHTPSATAATSETGMLAASRDATTGYLALLDIPPNKILVCDVGNGPETGTLAVVRAIEACGGVPTEPDPERARRARARLAQWILTRRGAATIDLGAASAARSRRAALTRVAQALARAPRHRRSALAPLADAARVVASASLPEGAERILQTLIGADLPDEAWLRSIAAFGELNIRPSTSPESDHNARILVVILFGERRP